MYGSVFGVGLDLIQAASAWDSASVGPKWVAKALVQASEERR